MKIYSSPIVTQVLLSCQYQLLSYKGDVDLYKKLAEWEQFYNFARPHGAHQGRAPYESLREKLI